MIFKTNKQKQQATKTDSLDIFFWSTETESLDGEDQDYLCF